jgi:hypothetical protein
VDFEDAAKKACQTELEDAKSSYPRVDDGNLPYICMDLVYQYTLLVVGFGRFWNSCTWQLSFFFFLFVAKSMKSFSFTDFFPFVGRPRSIAADYISEAS